MKLNRRHFLEQTLTALGGATLLPGVVSADVLPTVERVASPFITGEEQVTQKDIWAAEVRYKPVRMITVPITDPVSGLARRKLVWYIAYRVVIRSSSQLPDETVDTAERSMFVPELTLAVLDQGREKSYLDQVLPEALPEIKRREKHEYKSSVAVVAPLPAMTPEKSRRMLSLDGVATWMDVDPDTNNFAILFSGFSNGYKTLRNGETETVQRRVLKQSFWRPSDRFDQSETEIRFKDEPEWFYQ